MRDAHAFWDCSVNDSGFGRTDKKLIIVVTNISIISMENRESKSVHLGRFHLIFPGNQKREFPRLNSRPLFPLNPSGFDRIIGVVKNNGSHEQVL